MAFSKSAFIGDFATEAKEYTAKINTSIVSLKNTPDNIPLIKEVLRLLHTLKGSARMLDFKNIESLAHSLEDVFKGILEEKYELTGNVARLAFDVTECIDSLTDQIKETETDAADISVYTEVCALASSGSFFDPEEIKNSRNNFSLDEEENYSLSDSFENIKSVRIDLERINSIIQAFDNLMINQFRLKHQIEFLEQKLQKQTKEVVLTELPKQLKEDLNNTEDAIFEIQHKIFHLRMLPIEMVFTPLRKEVTAVAMELNKDIEISIPPASFMLDKIILEQLKTILIHLARNSIDHGIETPSERKAAGKNERGLISITATQTSNRIIITVKDDGRGIQYEKVRQKAIMLYPSKEKEISILDDKDLQQFIFSSGFSTEEKASEISGRGMGLDIVRNSMEKIKGKIKLESEIGRGTVFELTIPLTLATQRGLFVHSGNIKVMIPSHYIQEILTASEDSITTVQSQQYITSRNHLIPMYYLASILETPKPKEITSVIIVEYLETRMAIVVDSIQQNENVIVNPMPEILKRISALQGVVYDENYAIIPILDIPDIMQKMRSLAVYDMKRYQAKKQKPVYKILVVDDSITTRQIEQAIFESDGYKVESAVDGIDALEKLKKTHFDAIVTDISMPRMDGKILLSNIRLMEEYEHTPVIIVSGAYDPEEKLRFLRSGAQAFIVKSEFQRGNLLQAVKECIGEV